MGKNLARMGLTNKFLAESILVIGNFIARKKRNRERIYLQQLNNRNMKQGVIYVTIYKT